MGLIEQALNEAESYTGDEASVSLGEAQPDSGGTQPQEKMTPPR